MTFFSANSIFLFSMCLSWVLSSCSLASSNDNYLPLKAASLGNWLLIEGWMKPSMFDGIKNNDLMDGTRVQLMSMKLKTYLSAQNGGGSGVEAKHSSASGWETFRLWRINEAFFNLRAWNKEFVGLENNGRGRKIVAVSKTAENPETFQIIRKPGDPHRVRLKASNGYFLQAKSEMKVTADRRGSSYWRDDDPSVFNMTIVGIMHGEYQLTNGYGPHKARQIMQDHYISYITKKDFKFMSTNGINAVRIPVGWWIAHDPDPPKPFVEGSLRALDNAFKWAHKYRIKVIVDLHALRVSQNGYTHSASRDGFQDWTDSDIPETVSVIDFLSERYANQTSFVAIGLMNEPLAPGIKLETLEKFYEAGYKTVRKYTSNVYVILSTRLGAPWTELLPFARNLHGVVIDVHFYNLFSRSFTKKSVQQNIDFIYHQRASNLKAVTTPNGPLSFVGEWSSEWEVKGATKEDYQRFAKAQLDVYGNATFGWAYWAYKCVQNHWNLKWLIENNYIKL